MKIFLLPLFFSIILFANNSYKYTNELINSHSAYLLQHAHNPVNWKPWSQEVFNQAKKQNKLIFISIGYSTCHWCHEMEKESFNNEKIAKLLNDNYINIKVDKEQMPHIDTAFQEIHSKLKTRRNGWPLNLILNYKKEIVYITTYIPPSFKYGVEGMDSLLPRIANQYKNKDKKLLKKITLYKNILKNKELISNKKRSSQNIEKKYVELMLKRYDKVFYGFDKSPKFPLASNLDLLLDIYLLTNNKQALKMAINSLQAMAKGGIYDQIEGGFFRYSVYADWIIPHFEKMLYTTAELIPVYIKAYKITKNKLFKNIVIKSIEQINQNFKSISNLYYSAIDADSLNYKNKKQEGFYYVYNYDFVKKELENNNIKNPEKVLEYLGIDSFGNFDDNLNNPHIVDFETSKPKNLSKIINILKQIRKTKTFPFIDKKILTSWNSIIINALYDASYFNKKYLTQANNSLNILLKNVYINNTLYHQIFKNKISQKGYLEDYAFLINTLLKAYQTTYDKSKLTLAKNLSYEAIDKFYKNKRWYLSQEKQYLATFSDKYYTSALSIFFNNLITISNLTYDTALLNKSKIFIKEQQNKILENISQNPQAIKSIIRTKNQDIILKSSKQNLLKNYKQINSISYPFIYTTIEDTNMFLACDESSCFSYDKSLDKVILDIISK